MVNKVIWSPDGALLGAAYSRHLVHLFAYHGGDNLKPIREIDAHIGSVNDIAFSIPYQQLYIITCGDDRTVKVWDAASGAKRHTFEGHTVSVYSVCPCFKENTLLVFSADIEGRIKLWRYNDPYSKVNINLHGCRFTTLAWCASGARLFSCGTTKEGKTHLVEWKKRERSIRRRYLGFSKRSTGVVQFDTIKNRFLAAGEEHMVKFWDMNNIKLLFATDAGGGLPASPRIRFSIDGKFLAVSTNDNCIKILVNSEGLQLLHELEDHPRGVTKVSSDADKLLAVVSAPATAIVEQREKGVKDEKSRLADEAKIQGDGKSSNLPMKKDGESQGLGDGKSMVMMEVKNKGENKSRMVEAAEVEGDGKSRGGGRVKYGRRHKSRVMGEVETDGHGNLRVAETD